MRRSSLRDKHWLLLAILTTLLIVMTPVAGAQAQSEDQEQDQTQPPATYQLNSGDETPDSHARIVRISYVDGQVRIDRGQGYESATMNVPITERNWLQTRSDGWAEVQLEDGSLIRMAPDTVLAFPQLSRLSSGGTVTTVDLDQGEAEFRIAKRDDSEFQVTVKNKNIVLDHSASFRITSTNADPLEVVVWKGEVSVQDSESGGEVAVKKNETFVLDAMDLARYALDKGAEADQLDEWSKQRDDYLSTYASASHGYFQSPYQYGTGDLNYYGEYFDAPGYGTVWQPTGVGLGWDPFNNGYWIYSPGFGYTWVSAYPWGWLPYRYGNWVYINHRGWCWVPGNWTGWHTGPRWTNAPPGFRAPAPPPNNRIVIGTPPGGRVIIPGHSWDRGGSVRGSTPGGRAGNRDDDHGNVRGNRRVLTNDDVQGRAPRTDVPAAQPSASGGTRVFTNDNVQGRVPRTDVPASPPPSSGAVGADHRPKVVEQQPAPAGVIRQSEPGGSRGDRELRSPVMDRRIENAPPAERSRISNAPPPPQPVTPPSQPVRQYTPPPASQAVAPPAHQYTPPQPAPPVHQYTPPPASAPVHPAAPPASAPVRQSAPPAESHSNEGSRGRLK